MFEKINLRGKPTQNMRNTQNTRGTQNKRDTQDIQGKQNKQNNKKRSAWQVVSICLALFMFLGSFSAASAANYGATHSMTSAANYGATHSVASAANYGVTHNTASAIPPGAVTYVPGNITSPITHFAQSFIDATEGQQWLLDEVERLLNMRQMTIDRLAPGHLDFITSLGFANRNIEGRIPRSIGHFVNLRHLFMSDNRLSGELPNELFSLAYLRNIDLSNNLYTGNIDTRFYRLPALEVLRLSGNTHTGSIPIELTNIQTLRMLDLSDNRLTGGIPHQISNLTNLRYLDLSVNPQLGGEIPNSITTMTNLQVLAIWGSGLIGSIPNDIGNMTGLMYIDLGDNRLTGEIPSSIGNLEDLRELTIAFNQITGTIPDMFSNMERLLRVHIDRNYLRGHIPDSLLYCFTERNTIVTFSWNYLTGPNALQIERESNVTVSNGNFVDYSGGQQFRLASRQTYIQVRTDTFTNLFPFLFNRVATGNTNEPKPMRPYYEYRIYVVPESEAHRVIIEIDNGLNVRLTEEVSYADAITIVIKILANTSSEFSRVSLRIGTDPPPAGVGGFPPGGGAPGEIIRPPAVPEDWICTPYIQGYPDGSVRADRHISREEAAVMLFRIIDGWGSPGLAHRNPFFDVSRDRWSSGHIDFARREGLLSGYPDGTFRPAYGMSRNEFAVLLVNLTQRELITERPANFNLTDVPSNWAAPYIYTVHAAGYITGFPDGTFRGTNLVTRAEATRMLNQAMGRTPVRAQWTDDDVNPYNDLTRNHWAFYEILEASIEHVHQGGITIMPFHSRIRHQLEAHMFMNENANNYDNDNNDGNDNDNDTGEEAGNGDTDDEETEDAA